MSLLDLLTYCMRAIRSQVSRTRSLQPRIFAERFVDVPRHLISQVQRGICAAQRGSKRAGKVARSLCRSLQPPALRPPIYIRSKTPVRFVGAARLQCIDMSPAHAHARLPNPASASVTSGHHEQLGCDVRSCESAGEHCIVRQAVTVYLRVCLLLPGPGTARKRSIRDRWHAPALPRLRPLAWCRCARRGHPAICRVIEDGVDPFFSHAGVFCMSCQESISSCRQASRLTERHAAMPSYAQMLTVKPACHSFRYGDPLTIGIWGGVTPRNS